jgi:transcriptional regulator of met regulon
LKVSKLKTGVLEEKRREERVDKVIVSFSMKVLKGVVNQKSLYSPTNLFKAG